MTSKGEPYRWIVTDFGAQGDGQADDTGAFQSALDAAGAGRGTVFVPDGTYLCHDLKLPPHTGLVGNATWGYREGGGSVLKLNDPAAACLLEITGAVGATINGLSLHGGHLGASVHGIYMGPNPGKKEEDSPRIERCHIAHFSGDGIRLDPVWCFSIRSCEVLSNQGSGVYVAGWDGFILDNWLSGNGGAGYFADGPSAAVTMTGNRIEWNRQGGVRIYGGSHYNITGNFIDRSGGPAISLHPRSGTTPIIPPMTQAGRDEVTPCLCFSITGNLIYRSGKPEWTTEQYESAHARFVGVHGLVFSGNSMCVGQDDGSGVNSPEYGLVLQDLVNCVIRGNTLHLGALTALIADLGGHGEGVIVADNVGSVHTERDKAIWESEER